MTDMKVLLNWVGESDFTLPSTVVPGHNWVKKECEKVHNHIDGALVLELIRSLRAKSSSESEFLEATNMKSEEQCGTEE